jgi:hypothetical protein
MKAEATEDVHIVFRQLEFAIKLQSYCECQGGARIRLWWRGHPGPRLRQLSRQ